MLSGSSDYEDKSIQLEGLKNRLEAVLSPIVVETFTEQKVEKCKELWKIFVAMRRRDVLSVYRARCEANILKSRVPIGFVMFSPSALRDLHAIFLRHAAHQLEWAPAVCVGEETISWLVRLYGTVLTEINAMETLTPSNKTDSASIQLDQLSELITACDHFCSEIFLITSNDQEKKGLIFYCIFFIFLFLYFHIHIVFQAKYRNQIFKILDMPFIVLFATDFPN